MAAPRRTATTAQAPAAAPTRTLVVPPASPSGRKPRSPSAPLLNRMTTRVTEDKFFSRNSERLARWAEQEGDAQVKAILEDLAGTAKESETRRAELAAGLQTLLDQGYQPPIVQVGPKMESLVPNSQVWIAPDYHDFYSGVYNERQLAELFMVKVVGEGRTAKVAVSIGRPSANSPKFIVPRAHLTTIKPA